MSHTTHHPERHSRRPLARSIGADLVAAVTMLPRSIGRAVSTRGRPDSGARPGPVSAAAGALTSAGLGLVCWLLLLLGGPNTIRNWLYGVTVGADGAADAWGGPTLAGAWAVHAAIATGLLPVYLLVLHGLVRLDEAVVARLVRGEPADRWKVALAPVVALAGLLFLAALVRQA